MTDQNGNRFCTHCGANLPPDSTFCPECGTPVNGGVNPYQANAAGQAYTQPGMNPTGATPLMLMLYSVGAVVLGLIMLMAAAMLNEEMWNEMLEMSGMDMPYNPAMKTLYIVYGVCLIFSAVMAYLSYRHVRDLTSWKAAYTLCLLATVAILPLVMDLVGILMLLIGALVTYRIYRFKPYFTS